MFTRIENLLEPAVLSELVPRLESLTWEDGARTAGAARTRKSNQQLTPATPAAVPLLQGMIKRIMQNARIRAWAEPRRIARIMFSRYGEGMFYGSHNDAAITHFHPQPARADISFTVFLNDPEAYGGGELVLESPLGELKAKESAGSIVLYDTGLRHRVEQITSGCRLVVVGWIESLVRSPEARDVLHDLTSVLQSASYREFEGEEAITLRRIRANLLRMWSET
ncbi:MAG TPA: Fe2+-dependent dioxygenase [Verrucomicrobiales bacterium]|nr:Fe2+-dependent dioxygenase [Verrucomicrobiales bacterium]